MASAKEIVVKVIPSKIANEFVRKHHYSGKIVNNSQLHFGAFLNGVLHGVMSFGHSIDRRKILGLVKDTEWTGFVELNRLAFDEFLPRNSESRCLSIAIKLLKSNAPQIKWVVSFADACQCGDGAIYRASGFILTAIKKNSGMWKLKSGEVIADIVTRQSWNDSTRKKLGFNLGEKWSTYAKRVGAIKLEGFQLRYIYFIDKSYIENLTVPIIPFSEIEKRGAKMYLGKRPGSVDSCTASFQDERGGAEPTPGLNYGC